MTNYTLFCAQASTTPSRSLIEFKHAIRTFSSRSARENWSRARTLKISCRLEARKIEKIQKFQVENPNFVTVSFYRSFQSLGTCSGGKCPAAHAPCGKTGRIARLTSVFCKILKNYDFHSF